MADVKVYKNEDYTASRVKHDNGTVDYFIKYHSVTNPQEIKVTEREFLLYVDTFQKSLERQRKAKSRHITDKKIEEMEESESKAPCVSDFAMRSDFRISVEMVLNKCTPTQQRRFSLYHDYGYTFEEIAVMERCRKQRVQKSVDVVSQKIKNIF